MINHVTVKVKDFDKEEAFYEAALAPLGYSKGPAFPGVQAFVAEDGSSVWVSTAAEGDTVAPTAAPTTASPARVRTTVRPTMPRSCMIRKATTSKPCTTDQSPTDRTGIPPDGTRLPSGGIVMFPRPRP